ncbi:hypothetical protein ABID08_002042 [Rhizobium binae]|uniref:Uncharacterized protein n=1 Tax=Rhizobium binae TaxID=1138190 RepID=A0ABV2MDY7_9HYPH|nr:hypothetical protein J2J99_10550 [Rhizobium binae]
MPAVYPARKQARAADRLTLSRNDGGCDRHQSLNATSKVTFFGCGRSSISVSLVARAPPARDASAHSAFGQHQLPAKVADVCQEGSYRGLRIAFVISKHLCDLIINHGFADRLRVHSVLHTFRCQIGGRLADVLIMFTSADESIISLGKLIFKMLLLNCGLDDGASQVFPAAAQ